MALWSIMAYFIRLQCVESATDRAIELRAKGALSRAEAVSFPARPPVFSEVI
jgi:hypothetical protein